MDDGVEGTGRGGENRIESAMFRDIGNNSDGQDVFAEISVCFPDLGSFGLAADGGNDCMAAATTLVNIQSRQMIRLHTLDQEAR